MAHRASRVFTLAILMLCAPPLHAAAGDANGANFKVNTNNGVNAPAVAMGGTGTFAVVWQGSSTALHLQRFDASGVKQGSVVTTVSDTSTPLEPSAAADGNGNFVVVWVQSGSPLTIRARRFNADGTPVAASVKVNTTVNDSYSPDVAMSSDGKFVVVWRTNSTVLGQRYDASGAKVGSEFTITQTSAPQNAPGVATDSAGKFVVTWGATSGDGDSGAIYARRYGSDGTAATDEFIVNTTTQFGQDWSDVAMSAEGAFVITWINHAFLFQDTDVRFQRYDAAGAAAGTETPVTVCGGYDRRGPRASMDNAGNFMIAYERYDTGAANAADRWDVWGMRFNADGSAVGDAARVNSVVTNWQEYVAMGMDSDGDTVVVWEDAQTNSNLDLYGQRFSGSGGGGGGGDTTPDAFSFTDQTGVARSTLTTSAPITVAGIDAAAVITVTGGTYSINGGAFVSTEGAVSVGDQVRAQHTSSGEYSTETSTIVTIGGVSDTFTSTTEAAPVPDYTPDAFSFTDVTLADPETMVVSDPITVTGINAPTEISVTGGQFRIDGGDWLEGGSSVTNNQTVEVQVAAGAFGATVDVVVNIGGVSDTFSVTTRDATEDTVEDANGDTIDLTIDSGTVENLLLVGAPAFAPTGFQYENGFFEFDIACPGGTPGCTVVVTITLPVGSAPTAYVKCGGSACTVFSGASIAGNVVTLTLTDGGAGDNDGLANGAISDPGAPATAVSSSPPPSDDGGALDWRTLLGLLLLRRKRDRY